MTRRPSLYVVAGLAVVGAVIWALLAADLSVESVAATIRSARTTGPVGLLTYGAVYALASWAMAPGSWLMGSAGFLWGLPGGIVVGWLLSLIFGTASFLAAQGRLRRPVERVLTARGAAGRLAALDRAIARKGILAVALLRLSPMAPYNFVSYLLGLTGVDARSYFLGTALGSIVPALVWGTVGALASDLTSMGETGRSPATAAAIAAATLVASVGIVVFVKRALGDATSGDPPAAA